MKKIISFLLLVSIFLLTSCVQEIHDINRSYCINQCNWLNQYDYCMARCMSNF